VAADQNRILYFRWFVLSTTILVWWLFKYYIMPTKTSGTILLVSMRTKLVIFYLQI